MEAAALESVCFHCGGPLGTGADRAVRIEGVPRKVCCAGCAAAAELILSQGLERFYAFREAGALRRPDAARDWSTFDRAASLRRYTHELPSGERELSLEIEGLHCAACAWLIERSLSREAGVHEIHVNSSSARAQLRFDPSCVALSRLLQKVRALGFMPRPLSFIGGTAPGTAEQRAALLRLGVAGFGMMQLMTYAVSLYVGVIQGMTSELQQLLRFVSLAVATPVVLYSAQPFFVSAWRSVRAGTPGMDVPVALSIAAAYLWSAWATLHGRGTVYYDSAVMFTFFLLLGRYVEMSLRHRSGMQQDALVRLLPDSVVRLTGAEAERVTPDELRAGERVRVLPGERVPADGIIDSGITEVDESLLTGESAPRVRRCSDALLAGTLNLTGAIEMRVTRIGPDSTLAEVSRLLERAHAARPRIAELADRIASGFVACVLLLAALVGLYWLHRDAARAFPAVLAVLVVTCPCALSLATPAALAAATTRLARAGLLVTRSRALERLALADRVVLDKTGTLTLGTPRLDEVLLLSARLPRERCLEVAAALESRSGHPLARAFTHLQAAPGVSEVRAVAGCGLEGCVDGRRYRLGRLDYVLAGCATSAASQVGWEPSVARIVLGDSAGPLAAFRVSDTLREDARTTVTRLERLGLKPLIASGDHSEAVALAARRLGAIAAHAELRPEGKLALVQALQTAGHRVVMVGDGVNDAPVLAAADVSVAIASGTDLARVNADLVLLGERLTGLVCGVETSRRMLRIIRQNLAWALIYNLTAVPLAASGWLQPWMAALGMSLSSLLVVVNATRLLKRPGVKPAEPAGAPLGAATPST